MAASATPPRPTSSAAVRSEFPERSAGLATGAAARASVAVGVGVTSSVVTGMAAGAASVVAFLAGFAFGVAEGAGAGLDGTSCGALSRLVHRTVPPAATVRAGELKVKLLMNIALLPAAARVAIAGAVVRVSGAAAWADAHGTASRAAPATVTKAAR